MCANWRIRTQPTPYWTARTAYESGYAQIVAVVVSLIEPELNDAGPSREATVRHQPNRAKARHASRRSSRDAGAPVPALRSPRTRRKGRLGGWTRLMSTELGSLKWSWSRRPRSKMWRRSRCAAHGRPCLAPSLVRREPSAWGSVSGLLTPSSHARSGLAVPNPALFQELLGQV